MTNRRQSWALLGLILLAFVLRIFDLARAELWFDEALSAVIADKGWLGIIAYTQNSPFEHPPFYYLALYGWMSLAGSSEFSLRFFSLYWGILLLPLLYRFAVGWGGRAFGLLLVLVTALSIPHISHSQDARMYSFLAVLGVLLLICFFRATTTGQRGWWVGYVFAAFLGMATHYYFALMLLVPTVFLMLCGPRHRRSLLLPILIQLGCALLVLGWFCLSPGFQDSIQQMLSGQGSGSSTLGQRIVHTAGDLLLAEPAAGHVALAGLALLGFLLWPLPPPPATHPLGLTGSRRFVLVWLLVPWLTALAIPYWLQARHLAYVWPALYALIASGLLALHARSKVLFAAGLLLVAVTAGYGLVRQHQRVDFEFGRIMAYVEELALPDDLVVLNQPASWPFVGYYPRQGLDVAYVPEDADSFSAETVDGQLRSLVREHSRIWLGPIGAWTADPDALVERWLARRAFQVHKEWFPGSGSASLYVTAHVLELLPAGQGTEWEGKIRLLTAQSSTSVVVPGDGLAVSLAWEAIRPVEASHLVSLSLVDDMGHVWASRQSEPCGGWCPTQSWQPGMIVEDRHGLVIPSGTPPGPYRLQVGWYSPAEERGLEIAGVGQRLDLGEVQVVLAERAELADRPWPVPQNPLEAAFGDQLVLLGFELAQAEIPAGGTMTLALHWLAKNAPADDVSLQVALEDSDGHTVTTWQRPPSGSSFPTSEWRAGELVVGRHWLDLPPEIAPGKYRLTLTLVTPDGRPLAVTGWRPQQALGRLIRWKAALQGERLPLTTLQVTERPERARSFDRPPMAHALSLQLGQQVELLGYDLAGESARPGGRIELTLYWRGGGPTDRPYKVFTHLSQDHLPLAQHDGPPGEGCCPTDTWFPDEVVLDRHVIVLPPDLAPGTYRLTAGMYDEETGQRLPVLDGQGRRQDADAVLIAEIAVRPGGAPAPTVISPEVAFATYLPIIQFRSVEVTEESR